MSLSVVKVGGSLFDWPEFASRLQRWLDAVDQSRVVILPGGGKYVDRVRQWQRQHDWTDERAHRRALEMLRLTSRLMKRWLPEAIWINDPVRITDCASRFIILDCSHWAGQLADLPQNWDLTSDSLSAILATQLEAAELVLLKSRSPIADDPRQDPELVDPLFETYATTPVRIVNLRCPRFSESVYPRRATEGDFEYPLGHRPRS
jgi:aspartokinase-like uncharacterized kinase